MDKSDGTEIEFEGARWSLGVRSVVSEDVKKEKEIAIFFFSFLMYFMVYSPEFLDWLTMYQIRS